ncbi:MAG: hypothetical protein GY875_26135 [Gammaproteobacteria bacterium]|nr:hypothetical protein [Gammaproteobacteria bacterium]
MTPKVSVPVDTCRHLSTNRSNLHTPAEFAELVAGTGFEQVVAEDLTARFGNILQGELERIDTLPIDADARTKLRLSWQQKLRPVEAGEQRWGLISAIKQA